MTKTELLFYLVTRDFAQWLCRRRREKFAIEFRMEFAGVGFDPDEQVPKYSDAPKQVPYNQQLGQCLFG